MQVHRSIDTLPAFRNAVVTIGTFDGVHEGHRQIIHALCEEAKRVSGESVIITFFPHPRKVVRDSDPLQLLTTTEEKIRLLRQTGIDHVVIVPFTSAFALQTAEEYIADFLVNRFHPHTLIIGYDHRFGKGRQGDFTLLQEKSSLYNYRLLEIPKHVLDEVVVSSTKIRKAVQESNVETANRLLGYPFFFEGLVVKGDQLGRKLGYPTANLEYTDAEKIQLGHGVYAVYASVLGQRRKAMMSIGNRPTLTNSNVRVEVNLFDWEDDIYGCLLEVEVHHYLRGQEKYNSLDELVAQLHRDKERCLDLLA